MDCLVSPAVSILKRRYSGKFAGYRPLNEEGSSAFDDPIMVVVGKEKKEFLVEPFVLEESPFRVLIEMVRKEEKNSRGCLEVKGDRRVIYVDHVDSILFEHMLWLMHNDLSSLFKLNLKEIIDFYAQDN